MCCNLPFRMRNGSPSGSESPGAARFLGFHPNTVPMWLWCSTQKQEVFDEKISTAVSHVSDDSPASIVNLWDVVRNDGYERHDCLQDSTASTLPPDICQEPTVPTNTDTNADIPTVDPPSVPETPTAPTPARASSPVEIHHPDASPVVIPPVETDPGLDLSDERNDEPTVNRRTTRSGREIQAPKHLRDFILLNKLSKQTHFAPAKNLPRIRCEVLNHQRLSTLRWDDLLTSIRGGSFGALLSFTQQHSDDGFLEEWHPSLLSTKANLEDNPSWNEAMNGPFSQGFRKACQVEFDTLVQKDCWEVVPRPKNRSVVSSTWVFKVKRYPDGSMRKLKARFCARGYEQIEGLDYSETFAPVVNWTTVRFLLMMSILLGLETKLGGLCCRFCPNGHRYHGLYRDAEGFRSTRHGS
jgi:hypothetical protein